MMTKIAFVAATICMLIACGALLGYVASMASKESMVYAAWATLFCLAIAVLSLAVEGPQ
ncbi:MAG: hypothetical protein AB7Q00_14765 [Phycisphaerales bacterium]